MLRSLIVRCFTQLESPGCFFNCSLGFVSFLLDVELTHFFVRAWCSVLPVASECYLCTLYHRGFLNKNLWALFWAFCLIEITVCDWFGQQAFADRNKDQMQDLYSRSKLSWSTLKLLWRDSWKVCLFALIVTSLKHSFLFRSGVMVIPKNFMVFASSICFPLMFRLRLVCLFEGFWIACTLFYRDLFWFPAYHTTLWVC